jgi:hypothetical protein
MSKKLEIDLPTFFNFNAVFDTLLTISTPGGIRTPDPFVRSEVLLIH